MVLGGVPLISNFWSCTSPKFKLTKYQTLLIFRPVSHISRLRHESNKLILVPILKSRKNSMKSLYGLYFLTEIQTLAWISILLEFEKTSSCSSVPVKWETLFFILATGGVTGFPAPPLSCWVMFNAGCTRRLSEMLSKAGYLEGFCLGFCTCCDKNRSN